MNVVVKIGDLVRELSLLEKVVAKKATIAVLENVLIKTNGNAQLDLLTTDLELALRTTCPAETSLQGTITLPVKRLISLSKAQSVTSLTLTADSSGAVRFASGSFQSRLQALSADDFPTVQSPTSELPKITLPRVAVKDMLNQVRFAIPENGGGSYQLRGALMVLKNETLTFVTTDSSRLALASTQRPGPETDYVLLPSKLVDQLIALLSGEGDGPVIFSHSEQHLFFNIDHRQLVSRQIEGKFPAYERVIPASNDKKVQIPRAPFIAVLKRHVLIDDVIVLTLEENSLQVASVSLNVGEGSERVVVAYPGPSIQLRFKGQFLLDFLEAATGQTVDLSLKDDASAALLTDGGYLNVIMPMRL